MVRLDTAPSPPEEGLEMVRKVSIWGGLAFLLFFIAFRPDSAALVFKRLGGFIAGFAQGLGDFFIGLVTVVILPSGSIVDVIGSAAQLII